MTVRLFGMAVATMALLAGACGERYAASENNNNNTAGDCGNGVIDALEQCDGSDLQGVTCASLGFTGGVLACGSDCQQDFTDCVIPDGCGNGVLDPSEECDGGNLGGQDCAGLGFLGGSLACSLACRFDTLGCDAGGICGDGTVNPPAEECDGSDLDGRSCQSLGYDSGELSCDGQCRFDTGDCVTSAICGDNQLGPGELCDGALLGGATCQSLGFDGGVLACNAACAFDTGGCTSDECGDGAIQLGEECDGTNFGGVTCESLGFGGGQLACTGNCRLNTAGCTAVPEVCDNGIDDDQNGQCDCLDTACQSNPICTFALLESQCGDGLDNDHDCLVDCADPDCAMSPACAGLTCSPHLNVACGGTVNGTTVGGPTNFEHYPNACAAVPNSGPEAYILFNSAGLPMGQQVTVNLAATGNTDLDLIVVGSSMGDCDVLGSCVESSQSMGGVESVVFMSAMGSSYYFIVDGFSGAADAFTLTVSCQ